MVNPALMPIEDARLKAQQFNITAMKSQEGGKLVFLKKDGRVLGRLLILNGLVSRNAVHQILDGVRPHL